MANVLRYFPQQAFNLSFKDAIKSYFPKYDSKKEFWKFFATNVSCAGLGSAVSLTICYPLDFARTRLATDVGKGKKTYTGILDCLQTTASKNGVRAIYTGFGASVIGIVQYRGC